MKELRRRPKPTLAVESLDERMVPSVFGLAPVHHPAVMEHRAIRANMHHALGHRAQVHGEARVGHHAHRHLARLHAHTQVAITPAVAITPTATTPAAMTVRPSVATPAILASPSSSTSPSPSVASGSGMTFAIAPPGSEPGSPATPAPTPSVADIKNGPLAKAGQDLIALYQQYKSQGAGATFNPTGLGGVRVQGSSVGVDARISGGNLDDYVSRLGGLGMQILAKDAATGTVEGLLPISQLLAAVQDPQTLSVTPMYNPKAD